MAPREDWTSVPTFGSRPEVESIVRPGAYGLVADGHGRLAVVAAAGQGLFLPGGGIEPGETAAVAIAREAREECELVVAVGRWRARAIQFAYARSERTHFEKRSVFIDCKLHGLLECGLEPDHELAWLDAEEASRLLSQRWAVDRWLRRGS